MNFANRRLPLTGRRPVGAAMFCACHRRVGAGVLCACYRRVGAALLCAGRRRVGAALVCAGLAAGCSSTAAPAPSAPPQTSATVTDPIATSIDTANGPWATTAMGNLSDPLNTFWQLLHRRAGASDWTDQTEATATATNGGLVLAAAGQRIVAGVLPSQHLTFSPLVASSDGGRTWQTGLLPAGLAARPNALAAGSAGETLALAGTAVLESTVGLSGWQSLATLSSLDHTPAAASCRVTGLDAVAYSGTTPVLGTSCAQKGTAGVFVYSDGTWRAVGPEAPSLAGSTVSVLALRTDGSGIAALLGSADAGGTTLAATWSSDLGRTWDTSPSQAVPGPRSIDSLGPAGPAGFFALFTGPSSVLHLRTVTGPGEGWSALPDPPAATQTAVMRSGPDTPQVLSGDRTVLTVWNLEGGSWVKGQALPVQISFGSSS
jgi:hypothetical protein